MGDSSPVLNNEGLAILSCPTRAKPTSSTQRASADSRMQSKSTSHLLLSLISSEPTHVLLPVHDKECLGEEVMYQVAWRGASRGRAEANEPTGAVGALETVATTSSATKPTIVVDHWKVTGTCRERVTAGVELERRTWGRSRSTTVPFTTELARLPQPVLSRAAFPPRYTLMVSPERPDTVRTHFLRKLVSRSTMAGWGGAREPVTTKYSMALGEGTTSSLKTKLKIRLDGIWGGG